jgi:urocanate hydratase
VVDVWKNLTKKTFISIWEATRPLHNPYAGYYPTDISFEDANEMMANNPDLFKEKYRKHCRHTTAINKHTAKGTYFFDYGNAFLLEARAQI